MEHTRLLLARHGQTDWNETHRFQGQADTPLNETGLAQATALGKRLAGEPIEQIYSSDLQRALITAQAVAGAHDCPITAEPRLREMSFGAWEGLTYQQIESQHPEILQRWQDDMLTVTPPGGENLLEVAERVASAVAEILSAHPGQRVLLVAHGGPLQVLICQAFGLSPAQFWQFYLSPASLSEVRFYPAGPILNALNDTCHLEGNQWES